MNNHHFSWVIQLQISLNIYKWQFSIAMFVYERVKTLAWNHGTRYLHGTRGWPGGLGSAPCHPRGSLQLLGECRVGKIRKVPSGKLTVRYWKWPFILDFPMKKRVIFHSYVSLPEGLSSSKSFWYCICVRQPWYSTYMFFFKWIYK